jgi:DNA-binding MarR family transcriptional regulator
MAFRPSPYDVVEASRRVWLERWDAGAASGNAVVTSILRAHQMLSHQVTEVMSRHGLTFARYEVLAWLAAEPASALALSWISEVLRIPPATVTNLIDRLEDDGLLRRVPHPADARTTLAELTDEGRRIAHAATAELNDAVYRPLGLAEPEREQLVGLLQSLRAEGGEYDVSRSDDLIARLDANRAERPGGAVRRRRARGRRTDGESPVDTTEGEESRR